MNREIYKEMCCEIYEGGDWDRMINCLERKDKEIERLNKENNDLRKLYQRTYKHLFEKGNDELARYFQAQIDECSTFYVEPIIDYYEETKRLTKELAFERQIKKEVRDLINKEEFSMKQKYEMREELLKILDKENK